MSKPSLSAIFVGCGGFARNYLGTYRKLPFVRPVLCYDVSETVAADLARSFDGCEYTTDFARVKETPADFAVVSTPNFSHLEHATELLRNGKNVLLQKPLTRWLGEAQELHATALQCPGQRLGLYMSMLDFEMWWELRDAVREGRVFGKLSEISMRLGHTGGLLWSAADASHWRLSKEKTGGGAFIMLGVHYLHLIRWLTGQKIRRVSARTANLHCPHIEGEDICQVQAELFDGSCCQVNVAWNSKGEHFALYGTKGSFVYLDNQLLRVNAAEAWPTSRFVYRRTGEWQTYLDVMPPALDDAANPFNQHRQFAEAVRDDLPPAVDVNDGLTDMRVVDAVYRAAASGQWEPIEYES